jgi:hypothetical protein
MALQSFIILQNMTLNKETWKLFQDEFWKCTWCQMKVIHMALEMLWKAHKKMVEHVSVRFVYKKIMPCQSFCSLQNMTHEQRNMKTFQNVVWKLKWTLNGDDSHAIGNDLRSHVRKWCNMFSLDLFSKSYASSKFWEYDKTWHMTKDIWKYFRVVFWRCDWGWM